MKTDVFGFETDTVWGLGCDVNNEVGVDKIYEIKGRDRNKPLILMSYDLDLLLNYVEGVGEAELSLMKKYFPGALTVILKKSKFCPTYICEGKETVGIRIPDHIGFKDICELTSSKVLATTSLNFSNEPPCANYDEAKEKFGNVCEIIDPKSGKTLENLPSTIVDLTNGEFKILRQGILNLDAIFFLQGF